MLPSPALGGVQNFEAEARPPRPAANAGKKLDMRQVRFWHISAIWRLLKFRCHKMERAEAEKHDFSLNLSRVIEPKGGPGVEFANLEDAARVQPSGLQRMM